MPLVTPNALTIPSSPPTSPSIASAGRKKGIPDRNTSSSLMIPIELKNGCSEEGCLIESDDVMITNAVRKHFLLHFGHRDLDAIVSDYADDCVMINVVNGDRRSYHGLEEIRKAFAEIFHLHPTVNSTFHLKQIVANRNTATATWTATTPTHIFPESEDKLVYNEHGKICKQFFSCQIQDLDTPWYVSDE